MIKRSVEMKRGIVKLAIIIVIFLLLACIHGIAQGQASLKTDVDKQALITKLEKVIPELMKKAGVPGLSIAVIRDGEILWSGAFGIKSTKTGEPVTEDTIFEAASLTKPFFAYLALMMVEKGELDLDKPLIEYIPPEIIEKEIGHSLDVEGFKKDWFMRITARMVLSHSSGLPHGETEKPFPIFFEPGTQYRYSASGYYYLQKVIEHLKGEPLEEIMRKMVIEPLEMKNSCMVWQDKYETVSAVGHNILSETDGEFRKRAEANAAASLYTTARDYARFVMAMMNDIGLKNETINQMLTPQIDVDKDVYWGLGFGLERTTNGDGFWQWGDYGIFRNYIVAYKKHKIGVVYLTNGFTGLSICQDIVKNSIGGGKELGIAYLNYDQYDSPPMMFVQTLKSKGIEEAVKMLREIREKSPDIINERRINSLGYALMSSNKNEEAEVIFKWVVDSNPKFVNAWAGLGRLYYDTGRNKEALKHLQKALELDAENTYAKRAIFWIKELIQVEEQPVSIPKETLEKYAGDYGPRHVRLREGSLYYQRDGRKEYRLIPLSQDKFALIGLGRFRLRFVLDESGNVTKVIGIYLGGGTDESPRQNITKRQ
jgi:CubicO group peptidase (beta-lactamase class C family)